MLRLACVGPLVNLYDETLWIIIIIREKTVIIWWVVAFVAKETLESLSWKKTVKQTRLNKQLRRSEFPG
jgi:hypothetical protein